MHIFKSSPRKRSLWAESSCSKYLVDTRRKPTSSSPANVQFGARECGPGEGAGVGGEAGAEANRFGGIVVADLPGVGRGLGWAYSSGFDPLLFEGCVDIGCGEVEGAGYSWSLSSKDVRLGLKGALEL